MAIILDTQDLIPFHAESRRLMRVELELDLVVQSLLSQRGDRLIRTDGIPDDAEIVGVRMSGDHHNLVEVILHSAQFTELRPGAYIPTLTPEQSVYYVTESQLDVLGAWKDLAFGGADHA